MRRKISELAKKVGRPDADDFEGRVEAMLSDPDATLYAGALEWAVMVALEKLDESRRNPVEELCGLSDED